MVKLNRRSARIFLDIGRRQETLNKINPSSCVQSRASRAYLWVWQKRVNIPWYEESLSAHFLRNSPDAGFTPRLWQHSRYTSCVGGGGGCCTTVLEWSSSPHLLGISSGVIDQVSSSPTSPHSSYYGVTLQLGISSCAFKFSLTFDKKGWLSFPHIL